MSHFATVAAAMLLIWNTRALATIITVDFEDPPFVAGTTYGSTAGQSPGDLAFSQLGIDVTVENFTLGAFTGFFEANISAPNAVFGTPTQSMRLNNINSKFDMTSVSGIINRVVFDYVDAGGEENLQINATPRQEVQFLTDYIAPAGFAFNVTSTLFPNPATGPNRRGSVEIIADPGNSIDSVTIGGQEFFLDNFQAVPEPSPFLLLGLVSASFVVSRCAIRQQCT